MKSINNAVILARVSSKSQEDEGYSLDSQLKLLRNYCGSNELNIVKEFKIAETASKQQSRKIFQELLEYIAGNSINHLTVEKTDRLTRNLRDALAIDDWLEGDTNRMLHAVKENIRLHKDAKSDVKFMWNIHLAVAKKYADNLREEAMKGWAEKLAQGWLPSVPPVGYKTIVSNGKKIHVPDLKTVRSVQKVFKLYLEPNQTLVTVQAAMAEMGIVTRKGKPFTKSNVQLILKNPFYIGINRFDGKDYPGSQEPIIPEDVFKAVQAKLTRHRPKKYRKHNPVLKNMMTCAHCNRTITWQIQKGILYGSCQRKTETCRANKFVKEMEVHDQIKRQLEALICPSQSVINWAIDLLRSEYQSGIDNRSESFENIEKQVKRLQRMDEMLYDDKLSGDISQERYEKKHLEIQNQISELQANLLGYDVEADKRYREGVSIIELSQHAIQYYEEEDKDIDEKRTILTKLFENISVIDNSVSVKYTNLAKAIAAKSEESRRIMQTLKLGNQTLKNGQNNRSEAKVMDVLRPVWLGMRDSNSLQ